MSVLDIISRLNSRGVRTGVGEMNRSVDSFSDRLKGVAKNLAATFGAAAFMRYTQNVIEYGSVMSDNAVRTGIMTEKLSALHNEALIAGAKTDGLNLSMIKLKESMGRALSDDTTRLRRFEQLGITLDDINNLSGDTAGMFELLSRKFVNGGEEATDFSAVLEIIGTRHGPRLIEVMRQLADVGMEGVIEKARQMNTLLDTQTAATLDRLADKQATAGQAIRTTFGKGVAFVADFGDALGHAIGNAFTLGKHGATFQERWQEINGEIGEYIDRQEEAIDNTKELVEQQARIKQIDQAADRFAERQRRFIMDNLSDQAKLKALTQDLYAMQQNISRLWETDGEAAFNLSVRMLDVRQKIWDIQRKAAAEERKAEEKKADRIIKGLKDAQDLADETLEKLSEAGLASIDARVGSRRNVGAIAGETMNPMMQKLSRMLMVEEAQKHILSEMNEKAAETFTVVGDD